MKQNKFLRKQKKKRSIIAILFLIILVFAFDIRLKATTYEIQSDEIETPITIAFVADLHGCDYGENQQLLVNAIRKEKPDVVLLGGDIFDHTMSYEKSEAFLAGIATRYPCYYVTGNHEYWSEEVDVILDIISSYGVKILDGTQDTIEVNGETIQIAGIADPDVQLFTPNHPTYTQQLDVLEAEISDNYFSILLSHRPELIEDYRTYSYDLVLSGHAHGGQWRIPYVLNGLYAPGQGIFPKYAGGLYEFEDMDFIVSRGLAKESTPVPRIFNRPELVIVNITSEKK